MDDCPLTTDDDGKRLEGTPNPECTSVHAETPVIQAESSVERSYSPVGGWIVMSAFLVMATLLFSASTLRNDRVQPLAAPPRLLIDLNRATAQELEMLPNIGPALAGKMVDYIKSHGPLRQVEQLDAVEGIGPKTLEAIQMYLTISSNSIVDISSVVVAEPAR